MLLRMVKNDFKKSRWITISMILFIGAASMLLSLSAILFVNLSRSIELMMNAAETPHFMQMHTGSIDHPRMDRFVASNESVSDFQLVEFVNIDAEHMLINGRPLQNTVQDNGIVKQNQNFDFLLDLDNQPIQAREGEIFVPLAYFKDRSIKIGDTIAFHGIPFSVKGYLRDAQMNSPLSSSKRFLVHASDFESILELGRVEYLIEFRLNGPDAIQAFEADYVKSGLESNGPTLTDPLFRMINGVSDGLMMAVILLVSFIVVIIAFLCIRFTLLARLDDDYKEIGVLKAVGFHVRDIKRMYLFKYFLIAAMGSLLGFIVSLGLKGALLENVRLFMGISSTLVGEMTMGLLAAVFITVLVTAYVSMVLRRIKRVSVTESIRFGVVHDQPKKRLKMSLEKTRIRNTNVFLALEDIGRKKKLYLTMGMVIILSVFIINLPTNMFYTIDSESFITYMGVGECDLRIDVQQGENLEKVLSRVEMQMDQDARISTFSVFVARSYTALDEHGNEVRLKIELGDHEAFPIEYTEGKMPVAEDEIALSSINAEEVGLSVGEHLTIFHDGTEKELFISGIYSDLTNGGKTAKAGFVDENSEIMWGIVYADLIDPARKAAVVSDYQDLFPTVKVSDIDAFIDQTFGTTKTSFRNASLVGTVVALFIVFLITVLFIRMLVAKERYKIAVLKILGFTTVDLRSQFIYRGLIVTVLAILIGIVLSLTVGERLAELMIANFGVTAFTFSINVLFTYLILPLAICMTVWISILIGTRDLERVEISLNIKG